LVLHGFQVFKRNHRPQAKNKTTKNKFATPKWEGLGPPLLCCSANVSKNTNRKPENQKNKKQEKQKYTNKHENKKNNMEGPNSPPSLGCAIVFFGFFFVFV